MQAQQRAEGVAVGALVGGQQEAVAVAQLRGGALEVGGGDVGQGAHASSSPSSNSSETREAFSIVSS